MNEDVSSCRDLVRDEAVAWFARMRGPSAPMLEAAFAAWLDQGGDRREAYAQIARTFEDAGVLKQSQRYASVKPEAHPPHRGSRPIVALVSAVLVIIGVGWLVHALDRDADAPWRANALATRKGEIETYQLADGSSLTLDSQSRAQVARSSTGRRIRLLSGRARIAVKPSERSFQVEAGSGRLTASAGTFDVVLAGGNVTISSLEGQGHVGPLSSSSAWSFWHRPQLLGQGSLVRYGARSFADAVFEPATDRERNAAWPTGWATYRAVPLAALVAEVNRYASGTVVLDDRELERKQVSGRFRLTDARHFAQGLAELYNLQVVEAADEIHLRSAK